MARSSGLDGGSKRSKSVRRSAITGKFVSQAAAARNPGQVLIQEVGIRVGKRPSVVYGKSGLLVGPSRRRSKPKVTLVQKAAGQVRPAERAGDQLVANKEDVLRVARAVTEQRAELMRRLAE